MENNNVHCPQKVGVSMEICKKWTSGDSQWIILLYQLSHIAHQLWRVFLSEARNEIIKMMDTTPINEQTNEFKTTREEQYQRISW